MHSEAQERRSGPKAAAAGIVLAGGRSTRMGRPKAALEWHGSTLLHRVAGIVARAVDGPVIVVRAPGQELPPLPGGVELVDDAREGRGPLQGLAAGLAAVGDRADRAYVSSTDVPLLHPAFVGAVIAAAARDDVDVALPVAHGYRHPLAAAYGASLLGVVEALIAEDLLRPAALFERCRVRELDEDALLADRALAEADPNLSSLLNVNDPDEYERARARSAPRGERAPGRHARRATAAGARSDLGAGGHARRGRGGGRRVARPPRGGGPQRRPRSRATLNCRWPPATRSRFSPRAPGARRMPILPTRVRPVRVALSGSVSAADACLLVRGDERPFALAGAWAGGGALVGSEPVAVAAAEEDPFALLDRQPDVADGDPAAVGGGWFGYLGYRLGARLERVPPGPPRPTALPDFALAYLRPPLAPATATASGGSRRSGAMPARPAWNAASRCFAAASSAARRSRPVWVGTLAPSPQATERTSRGRGRLSRADRRGRDLPGQRLPAPRGALVGRPARPLRPHPRASSLRATRRWWPDRGERLCSASPELFLRRRGRHVLTEPIKGTAPRESGAGEALSRSAKDRAENVMIVDLMRNDLGRVCEYGSVEVPGLTELREAPGVWHLVSTVSGTLRPGRGRRGASARDLSARLGHRRPQDPRHARDRRARGHRTRGLHGSDRLRQPGRGAGAERRHPHARDERRANLAGCRGWRGGRLGSPWRARGSAW